MAWFLALAYRRLGWQVATFSDRTYIGRGLTGLPGKALQLLERDYRVTRRSQRLGQLVVERARSCDLVVTVKGEYFLPEDVAAVSAVAPFVNWHPDHPVLTQSFACIPYYTAFCPKDSWSTQRLRNMGHLNVSTLAHASDPIVLGGSRHEPAERSFSVVGSSYPYRRHWVEQGLRAGLTADVWGRGSGFEQPGVTARQRPAVGAAQGQALRSGCFTLNTHHPYDVAGGNQRVFDAAAAGAPQLTERLPESVRHFKSGTEIATFEDLEEFRSQVLELSGNAPLRQALARNSHQRVCDEHTYEHRVRAIQALV
ncbi:MAG: hypothetical protein JWN17_3238 [Frankiales bacterium]|nr:hypothetical protein [Frankiales bacterium]